MLRLSIPFLLDPIFLLFSEYNKKQGNAEDFVGSNQRITLVDLAGSERNADTFYHDADQIRESQAINSSLRSLKECLRKKNIGEVPIYRESLLISAPFVRIAFDLLS